MKQTTIESAYSSLLASYGPMGWWPLISKAGHPGFDERGYHKNCFRYPETNDERFEIALGAILTQNTAWKNVEIALRTMHEQRLLSFSELKRTEIDVIAQLIRPCGYFNQKTKKIRFLMEFLTPHMTGKKSDRPEREALLNVWGIGEETADSILLYAYDMPHFVVDAYTRRIFGRIGIAPLDATYNTIADLCRGTLPADAKIYNEYHALIVEHAKRHCKKKPVCEGCMFGSACGRFGLG